MTSPEPTEPARRWPTGEPYLTGGPGTTTVPTVTTTTRKKRKGKEERSGARSALEWVLVVGGALVLALIIRTFLLAAFYIPSESMVNTLEKGDRVLVNKLSYHLHPIHRGDVVVFERPPGEPDTTIKDLIKRVVGLSGDVVEGRDCKVLINGQALNEPYTDGKCTSTFGPISVPDGQIFVMGDNRPASQDSRVFGPIDEDLVVGRAFVIIWPIGHWGWL